MNAWVGRTLGNVQIESLIARGGVAEVYLGTHTSLQRKVAVKILREQYEDDPGLLERFQREAVVVSRLRHPNIVQIYDFDSVAGHPYIVMEHIAGPSLSRYLDALHAKGKRLDLPVISRLLTSVASALEYAHKMGVIHRDVKPGNILLTSHSAQVIAGITMPAGFEPILTDFGLVRFLNSSRHTTAGQIAGTPAYMSPEQARGEATDDRTDIYSLGIVLYEMLSGGRVPFEGETTMSVLMKQIHDPVTPIPGLAPSIQEVLDHALAKDRRNRYQSPTLFASEFQKAIEQQRFKADTLVHDTPAPMIRKSIFKPQVKWWRPVVLGLVAIGVGAFLWFGGLFQPGPGIIPETGGTLPAVPTTASPIDAAPDPLEPAMVLRFRDGSAIADQAELIAQAMPLPPAGSQYEAWLIGGDARQSLGLLTLNEKGDGRLTYTDAGRENLIGLYDRVEVSIESVPDADPGSAGQVAYSSTMPGEGFAKVRNLLAASPDTPEQKPIIQGLISNVRLIQRAAQQVQADYENGNAAGVIQGAETILNLVVGDQSPDYKDWDEDGTILDPFDGYGLLPNGSNPGYIQAVYSDADFAVNAPDVTLNMINHGETVKICSQNLANWAPQLHENVLAILSSTAGSNLEQPIANSVRLADQLLDGVDIDANGAMDSVEGECGAETAVESSYRMAEMPLLPASLLPTATITPAGMTGTPVPSLTTAPVFVSPTRSGSGPQNTAVPPAATKPGNRQDDKPKPTKKKP